MRILLSALALIAMMFGVLILAAAQSAVHEIEGYILFLIAMVGLSGAGVIGAVHSLRSEYTSPSQKMPDHSIKENLYS